MNAQIAQYLEQADAVVLGGPQLDERKLDEELLEGQDKEVRVALGSVGTDEDEDPRVGYSGEGQKTGTGKRPHGENDDGNREERAHERTRDEEQRQPTEPAHGDAEEELIDDGDDSAGSAIESDGEEEPEDEEVREALKKEQIVLTVVEHRYFEKRLAELVHYRYLVWACFRGHVHVVYHIIKTFHISPFLQGQDGRSPFMAAIEGNQDLIVRLLLNKDFRYPPEQRLIETQRQARDKLGNNPLHKAFRFRNHKLIRQLMSKHVDGTRLFSGSLTQRNRAGRLPLEIPHNDILVDEKVRRAVEENLPPRPRGGAGGEPAEPDFVVFNKEPDYIFVADRSRVHVLTDQLATINDKYTEKPRDVNDSYGLLTGFEDGKKFLAYREYRKSDAPDTTVLVLVFFSDRILNLKAEELGMRVQLQDKYQTLPFVLEAQQNFVRFNASQR